MFPVIFLGGLIAYSLFKQSTTLVDSLTFTPKKISLPNNFADIFQARANMLLNIANNSNVTATIDSIVGKIFSNGTTIGTYEILQPFKIPAKNNVNVNVLVSFYNTDFLTTIVNIIKTGKTPALSLSGNIRTQLGNFDFKNEVFRELTLINKK